MENLARYLAKGQEGQALVEYTLLLVLILFGAVMSVKTISYSLSNSFSHAEVGMTAAGNSEFSSGQRVVTDTAAENNLPRLGSTTFATGEKIGAVSWLKYQVRDAGAQLRSHSPGESGEAGSFMARFVQWWYPKGPALSPSSPHGGVYGPGLNRVAKSEEAAPVPKP